MDKKKRHEVGLAVGLGVIMVAVYFVGQMWPVRDFFSGLSYQPGDRAQEIREALALTGLGERILAATQPAMETGADFNEHCESHNADVSLLGCYAGGRIYVYEITRAELTDSNKVTMAHELLHAVWERMGNSERVEIIPLLREVEAANMEWFETELASYGEEQRIEEIYTRAGTKLSDLPAKLEENYAKYFTDRARIVGYYENYQAPFRKLQEENGQLEVIIMTTKAEIMAEREAYLKMETEVEARIAEFNRCANQAGCFQSREEFEQERSEVIAAQEALELTRNNLNAKIDENNARVELFYENQLMLGELSKAMNSNMEEMKEEL